MAEQTVVEEEKPVVDESAKTPESVTEDKTLLGDATEEAKPELDADGNPIVKEEPTAEEKAAKEAADKALTDAKAVPEKYDVKVPEGYSLDQTTVETLTPVFKELGLTNEGVNKLVTTYAPIMKAQVEAQQKAAMDAWAKETDGWKAETVKLLGGDAKKELAYAAKVINSIGTKYKSEDGTEGNKLRDLLEDTKVGNHPEITKLFISLGKRISADTFVEPNQTSAGGNSFTDSVYTHPDSKGTLK